MSDDDPNRRRRLARTLRPGDQVTFTKDDRQITYDVEWAKASGDRRLALLSRLGENVAVRVDFDGTEVIPGAHVSVAWERSRCLVFQCAPTIRVLCHAPGEQGAAQRRVESKEPDHAGMG